MLIVLIFMIYSKYWASAYLVWIICLIYFHSIVSLEAFNIVYIHNTTSFITFQLDNFLHCFRIVTSCRRCSYSCLLTCSLSSLSCCLRKMIDGLVSYLLNIAGTWLKLLHLVLYLVHKGQLVLSFSSIIFLKPCFTRYNFVSISIDSDIWIWLHLIY